MTILQNHSLKDYNTFGLNVQARYFAEVTSIEDIQELIGNTDYNTLPWLILGGGSNVLFTKDFDGLVVKNSLRGIEVLQEDESQVWLKAAAGEVWHQLVMHTVAQGWGGIENLSLIPGLVGAAPMQNIGAYGVELEQVFESLEAVHLKTGEVRIFNRNECQFGYRESVFKKELKGQYLITSITIRLQKQPVFNTSYGAIQQTLEEAGITELSVKAISDAVIAIRQSKLPDPKELGNSGSFFKNPEISREAFAKLQANWPNVPHYPLDNGNIKVPAGWLIEQAGWKGKRVGNTGSHAKQALVLVNYGGATGSEVWQLAQDIQQSVKEKFGIEISPEVNVI